MALLIDFALRAKDDDVRRCVPSAALSCEGLSAPARAPFGGVICIAYPEA